MYPRNPAAPKAERTILRKFPFNPGNTMNLRLIFPLLALLSTATFAADPPAAPESTPDASMAPPPIQPIPKRRETLRSEALAEQLKPLERETEITWLGSGDDKFLALYKPDHSGETFASALILHDNQQHPDWPGVVKSLRQDLAAHGWNTLAIQLPDYLPLPVIPEEAPPPSDSPTTPPADAMPGAKMPGAKEPAVKMPGAKAADPATATETPEPEPPKPVEYPPEKVPDIVDARTREAVSYLKQKSDAPIVIVACGLAATIAAKKAQTMLIADIAGIIIIDPMEPASLDYKIDLDAMDLRIPILDIAPEFDPRSNPKLRRDSARRAGHEFYEQRIIRGAGEGFTDLERTVEKTVRGWGERNFKP